MPRRFQLCDGREACRVPSTESGPWSLAAYSELPGDRRDNESTYAMVVKKGGDQQYSAPDWTIQQGSCEGTVTIILASNDHGQIPGRHLAAHSFVENDIRDDSSTYAMVCGALSTKWVLRPVHLP